ncbi:MAG: MobA/MobL family protein [Clostridia bacterium]|nr:MobA/MobL family protein [Clostridia bacterium]
MALYHFHVGQIKRSAGQSAIACAAYRAGEKLYSEYYGETNDFTRKQGILHTEILLPPHAPRAYADRQTLWNAVETVEKNKKAQLAYSFDIALQNELSMEENIALARQFVQENFVSKGMIADLAVHAPDEQKEGISNPHFHVMTTMRPLNPDGTWGNKQRREYVLDEQDNRKKDENGNYIFNAVHTTDWGEPETLDQWRKAWCDLVNDVFECKGISERIDHRSYEEQGLDQLPTVHEGPQIQEMESRGIKTNKADLNRWIRSINRLITRLKEDIAIIKKWLAARKAYREKLKEPGPADYITQYAEMRNQNAWSGKAKKQYLQKMLDTFNFIKKHNLRTMDDLEAFADSISEKADNILAKSRANSAQIKKLDEMIRFGKNILENQPVIDQLNTIRWNGRREKFHAAHETEINLYQMSKRILKQKHGVQKRADIDIRSWEQEKSRLQAENEKLYAEYKPLKEQTKGVLEIRRQMDVVHLTKNSSPSPEKHPIR